MVVCLSMFVLYEIKYFLFSFAFLRQRKNLHRHENFHFCSVKTIFQLVYQGLWLPSFQHLQWAYGGPFGSMHFITLKTVQILMLVQSFVLSQNNKKKGIYKGLLSFMLFALRSDKRNSLPVTVLILVLLFLLKLFKQSPNSPIKTIISRLGRVIVDILMGNGGKIQSIQTLSVTSCGLLSKSCNKVKTCCNLRAR